MINISALLDEISNTIGLKTTSFEIEPIHFHGNTYFCGICKLGPMVEPEIHLRNIPATPNLPTIDAWVTYQCLNEQLLTIALEKLSNTMHTAKEIYHLKLGFTPNQNNYNRIIQNRLFTTEKEANLAIIEARKELFNLEAEVKPIKLHDEEMTEEEIIEAFSI